MHLFNEARRTLISFSVQPDGSGSKKNLNLLFKAPPKSQSHGLQPARSLLRPQYSGYGRERFCFNPSTIQLKPRKKSAAAATAATTYKTLVAVASRHVSFAGAVAADLVAGSPHHDDATRVAVARCCKNKRKELQQVCTAGGDHRKKSPRFCCLFKACCLINDFYMSGRR